MRSVSLSPDNKYIVSGSSDKTVRVWEIATGKTFKKLEGHADAVKSVMWSRDVNYIVSGSSDATVRVWEVDEQVCEMHLSDMSCLHLMFHMLRDSHVYI